MEVNFEELYAQYSLLIYKYLLGRIGNPQQVEDMVQEVFLRAWLHLEDVRDGNYGKWLMVIARNHLYDVLRRGRLVTWIELPSDPYYEARNLEPMTNLHIRDYSQLVVASGEDALLLRLDIAQLVRKIPRKYRIILANYVGNPDFCITKSQLYYLRQHMKTAREEAEAEGVA